MRERLYALLARFIPLAYQSDPIRLMRSQVVVGVTLTNFANSCLVFLVLLLGRPFPPENQQVALSFTAVILAGYFLVLCLFRYTGWLRVCSNLVVLVLFATLLASISVTGGYFQSPIMQLMLLVPLFGFLLTGMRDGVYWMLLTIFTSVMLAMSEANPSVSGFQQLMLHEEDRLFLQTGLQLLMVTLMSAGLVVYEMLNDALKVKLREERNQFAVKASRDTLTDLPNRDEFFRRLQLAMDECRRRGHKLAIVYLDLDGFKPINDQLGHEAGDIVLQRIAHRLEEAFRQSDTVARIGGDEFAVLLPAYAHLADLEDMVSRLLKAVNEAIIIESECVYVAASAGIALYPEHGSDVQSLCRNADAAMYTAKRQRNTYAYFSPEPEAGT